MNSWIHTLAAVSLIVVVCSTAQAESGGLVGEDSQWQQPAPQQCPDLYCWSDICNVYVLSRAARAGGRGR